MKDYILTFIHAALQSTENLCYIKPVIILSREMYCLTFSGCNGVSEGELEPRGTLDATLWIMPSRDAKQKA